jgi:hypothetical protein
MSPHKILLGPNHLIEKLVKHELMKTPNIEPRREIDML